MRIRRWNGNFVITIPMLNEPRPSKTGKSILVATSRGLRKSKLKVDGRNILYAANAFFYPTPEARSVSGNAKKRGYKVAAASKISGKR
jgi:hypothetical protein